MEKKENKDKKMNDFGYHVQVDKNHYSPKKYVTIQRWSTHYRVVKEVLNIGPNSILEIGPGNGLVTCILKKIGFNVKTLDFDSDLEPDYVIDIANNSLGNLGETFDLVIASQVLEHIRYSSFLKVMKNLSKMTNQVLLTLPDTNRRSKFLFLITNKFYFARKIVYFKRAKHIFEGQHYWEIGKKGYPLKRIKNDLMNCNWSIKKNYLNFENPYHRLLLLANKNHPHARVIPYK
ncbi:MAG: class I SAM-dependent methyltransferase [Promethearchaeota archaeon]